MRRTDRGSECCNTQVCSISVSPMRVAKPRVGGVLRRSHRAPICDSVHSTVAVKVSGLLTSTFTATLGYAATQVMRYLLRGLYKTWVGVHLSFCFRKSYPGSLHQITTRLGCYLQRKPSPQHSTHIHADGGGPGYLGYPSVWQ